MVGSTWMSNVTFCAFADELNDEIPLAGTLQYEEWKQNYLNQSARSVFGSRLTETVRVSGNKLSNDYIELAVSSNGRYTIGTSGGNPESSTDNNKKLLYGHSSPGSSYTTIRVDEENYIFGEGTFTISPSFDEQLGMNKSEQMIDGLRVKQELSIVKNTATDREDLVEIKYIVKNESTSPKSIGVRIMMDTMLGANDAVPFRVRSGVITHEREYAKGTVPQYWQAFDSLESPQVVSQGTLLQSVGNNPDRVQFTNWRRVHDCEWGYKVNTSYSNGDSAVSVIWDTNTLMPREEREFVTYYGLSEMNQDMKPPLAVGLYGDASVNAIQGGYEPNPIVVTTYIYNSGSAPASNVKCSLQLPHGLNLVEDEREVKEIGDMAPGQEEHVSWAIWIEPSDTDKILEYSVDVWADEVEAKSVKRKVNVPTSVPKQELLKTSGVFKYTSTASKEVDYEAIYYYDDAYFLDSSYIYDSSLATMSLCLAMASGGSNEKTYAEKSDNAKDLLTQIGFSQFDMNDWFIQKPTADSIGVVAANKKLCVEGKEYTLIAVGIRGFGYEQEWASNFTMGEVGQHQGFEQAKNSVLEFLRNYIAENNISGDVKLWITGFSRAGGTANLVAGALDDGEALGDCILSTTDLYTYTFEAPQGAVAEDAATNPLYANIFNIINPADPVPKVAPVGLGFSRYGEDVPLPAHGDLGYTVSVENMKYFYNEMTSTDQYLLDEFAMKRVFPFLGAKGFPRIKVINDIWNRETQGIFLNTVIQKIVKEQFKSRSNYVEEFQDGIREIFKVLNGTKDTVDGKQDVKWAMFREAFEAKIKSNAGELIVSALFTATDTSGAKLTTVIEEYAIESLNEVGITSYDKDEIHEFAETIAETVVDFAVSHPNLTATLICNLKSIGSAHHPELCYAWLQTMDENYTESALGKRAKASASRRIIRVNCPVDIEVYDETAMLVAQIKADEPQVIEGSDIISSINEDGEKLIYLPALAGYTVKLVPTEQGVMTYSVNEYNFGIDDITRVVNYYDISIQPGEVYIAEVPKYSEEDSQNRLKNGSSTEYTLFDSENELITASEELRGTDATEAYYMVYAEADNEEYGYVIGQGIRQRGNYAQVSAIPFENCEFEGWYINEQKVSSELEYRFRVQEDVEIVGKFICDSEPENVTEKSYEGENFKVTFSLVDQWDGGYNANIKIENIGDSVIENWYLGYDLNNVLTSMWNAEVVSYESGQYVVKNAGWNADIPVGGSVQYGISVNENFTGFPRTYELLGENVQLEESAFSTEYYLDSDWGSGFTGRILITNKSDKMIEDWMLECDFGREITSIWGATIESHKGTRYVIKNAGYNANIAAGQTIVIGFNGEGGDTNQVPIGCILSSYSEK